MGLKGGNCRGCFCSDLKEGKIIMITPMVDGIWTLDSNRDTQSGEEECHLPCGNSNRGCGSAGETAGDDLNSRTHKMCYNTRSVLKLWAEDFCFFRPIIDLVLSRNN